MPAGCALHPRPRGSWTKHPRSAAAHHGGLLAAAAASALRRSWLPPAHGNGGLLWRVAGG